MSPGCPSCGGVVKPGASACSHCRASISWGMQCEDCGQNSDVENWVNGKDPIYGLEAYLCPKCKFPANSPQMQCPSCLEETFVLFSSCNLCGRDLPVPKDIFTVLMQIKIEDYRKGKTRR